MNDLNVFCANLKGGNLIIADKGRANMAIYPAGSQNPVFKLNSAFDILALRDLLNDAYPPEVYKHGPVRRMS